MTDQPDGSAPDRRLVLRPAWLISRNADLLFLIGSVLVSFALFFAWRNGTLSTATLVLIWIFAFHGPHFWGTVSRTYLDRAERARRGATLRRAFLWFLAGPILVSAGFLADGATGAEGDGAAGEPS